MKKFSFLLFCFLSACSSIYKADELDDFKGETMDEVLYVMGKPASERKEGDNKMWAYCQDECFTLIFFDADNVVQYAEQRGNCPKDTEEGT